MPKGTSRPLFRLLAALLAAGALLNAAGRVRPAAETEEKLVALTFDDGPGGESTLRLLDGLRRRGVRATFFVIGRQAEEQGELVLRMARDGHQIGIHTYDHLCMRGMSRAQFTDQTERARRVLRRLLGDRELWLRPPYGLTDANTARWEKGPLILWSVDPEDWRDTDAARIRDHIVENARDGDVILLHDVYESSVDAALEAVDALLARGFRFVTVERLLAARGVRDAEGRAICRAPAG